MDALKATLFSGVGDEKGTIDLPSSVFVSDGSLRVLHEVIVALQANQRRGTSETKTRGNVRGGGRKPWKQKHTGNARSGSIRSPLWRKGGIIFGPHPRSYRIDIDQTKRWSALQTALTEKAKVSALAVMESLKFEKPKSREAKQILTKAGAAKRVLLVVDQRDTVLQRAVGNLCDLHVVIASELNALQVMTSRRIIFTKAGLEALEKRCPKG